MIFRTELKTPVSPLQISHKNNIITTGSCFSNVIGEKLSRSKFKVTVNPYGIIYNPISVFRLLNQAILLEKPSEELLVEREDTWYHFDLHSEIWDQNKSELCKRIFSITQEVHKKLQQADIITITPGTAFVYELIEKEHIVANCHKLPAKNFSKKLLSAESIIAAFDIFYKNLEQFNRNIQVLFTVSPVRHIKDSIELNSVSKSILRYAIHEITNRHKKVFYFPSYEIMMDDLRDYRFYKEDMIHPNEVAEKYIWEKFTEKHMSPETTRTIKEWEKIIKAINHKPFHPDSPAHKSFLTETLQKIKGFNHEFDISEELDFLRRQIS